MVMMNTSSASTRFRLRALVIAPAAALLALAAAGCGGSYGTSTGGVAGARHTTSTVVVNTRKITGYGNVLVNAKGHTLYVFMKDKRRHVTCTGSCTTYWPALKQKGTHKATARGGAKASLIGSDKDPAGGRVVTYSKWPLYTYVGDSGAGTTKGEGLNLSGGRWFMISPAGTLIKKKTSGGGGGTTTGGGWA
jgi:predicted lipoprotein with Yx(FWY)xxD motif